MAGRDGDILGYYVINFCDAFLDYGSEILCRRSSEAARDFERWGEPFTRFFETYISRLEQQNKFPKEQGLC